MVRCGKKWNGIGKNQENTKMIKGRQRMIVIYQIKEEHSYDGMKMCACSGHKSCICYKREDN